MAKIKSIKLNPIPSSKNSKQNTVSFKAAMHTELLKEIKMCVYDLDESLLDGSQIARDRVMSFSSSDGRRMFYSSLRDIGKIQEKITDGTLIVPDGAVAGEGINIYGVVNGAFKEIESWSQRLAQKFHKDKIRGFALDFARSNKMTPSEYAKVDKINMPEIQRNFDGSRVTEYETYGSPLNISFMLAPGVSKENFEKVAVKYLADNKINGEVKFRTFDPGWINIERLNSYFAPRVANNMRTIGMPMRHEDGSLDCVFITSKSNKGEAAEYLRNELALKAENVLSAGDDVGDFSHVEKGYFFIPLNPKQALKDLIASRADRSRIVNVSQGGSEGILEAISP